MKIEAGKFYRTRDGQKVLVEPWGDAFFSVGCVGNAVRVFHADGKHGGEYAPNTPALDLIAEWRDTPQVGYTGTLEQLGVKAGDVVECVNHSTPSIIGQVGVVNSAGNAECKDGTSFFAVYDKRFGRTYRIVSRAGDKTKIFDEMTDAEQGALLLAKHRGEVIQVLSADHGWQDCRDARFIGEFVYRVKPKDEVKDHKVYIKKNCLGEWVTMHGGHDKATHEVTFNEIDGEIDCASAVLVKL